MTSETWFLLRCILRRKFIMYNFFIMTFMVFMLPINALDIQLDGLLGLSQFHCFNENNICTSPLEYCNSFARECRPCTADICARKGGDDFPLQCSLNCSIAHTRLSVKEATDKLRELKESNSDIRELNAESNISISDLKIKNQELNGTLQETKDSLETVKAKLLLCKQEVNIQKDFSRRTVLGLSCGLGFCLLVLAIVLVKYKVKTCCKSSINKDCCSTPDEERGLCQEEESTSTGEQYCEKTLKGMCETNEDTQKTIATTQAKALTPSSMSSAVQSDPATTVKEDKESESAVDEDTCSKQPSLTENDKLCMDSAQQSDPVTKIKRDRESDRTESNLNEDRCTKQPSLTENEKSSLDSAPLNEVPRLDFTTFDGEDNFSKF